MSHFVMRFRVFRYAAFSIRRKSFIFRKGASAMVSRLLTLSLCSGLLLCGGVAGSAQSPQATAKARLQANFGNIPLSFEANRGQAAQGAFVAHGDGYSLTLAPASATLHLQKSTLSMNLLGTQPTQGNGAQMLPGKANYFIGAESSKWKTAIPTYARVAFPAVYPGIDLVYYGNQRQLEYDFVVAPHADANAIALSFSGAAPRLDGKSGDLVLATASGETRFHKPVVYQMIADQKVAVAGSYTLAGNRAGFALGAYDHNQPLTIDPVLSYLTYLGGSQDDQLNGLAIDSAGNAYVVGTTTSTNFPLKTPYTGTDPGGTNGNRAMFVSKFNSIGTALIYSTYLGGTGNTFGNGIAVDSNGNAYVVGYVDTGGYPLAGAMQSFCGGANAPDPMTGLGTRVNGCTGAGQGDVAAVVTKLNASGTGLVYSTYLSGNNFNDATAIAVNAAGEAYVVGLTNSQCNMGVYGASMLGYQAYDCFPTTAGAVQAGVTSSTGGGTRNFTFLSKFNASGSSLLYSTLLGPTNFQQQSTTLPLAVAVDPAGLAYVSGYSSNNLFTTAGTYQPAAFAANSAYGFVAKFDPTAQRLIYSTYVTGPKGSQPYVTADAAGNAYLAGNTNDCSYPTTAGVYQTQAAYPAGTTTNCNAGFVSKLNPTGTSLLFSTFLGNAAGTSNTIALHSIALGSDGSIYVAGNGSGVGYPEVNPVVPLRQISSYSVVSRLNPSGSALLFSTTIGGTTAAIDLNTGIALDPAGNIYVAGITNSLTLPTTPGAFLATNNKGGYSNDSFVAKIAPTLTSTTTLTLPGNVTAGQPTTFTAQVAGPTGTTTIPTGTVTFSSGSNTLGTSALDATGKATYTAPSLNATTYTVSASYAGDTSFSASISAPATLLVAPATPAVTLTAPATANVGSPVTLSVQITGTGATPGGTVTFNDGNTVLSTAALVAGAASYTTSTLAAGVHNLTVKYGGDSIFAAASSASQTLTVSTPTASVTLSAPATALVGAPVTLSANVTGTGTTPTGTVTFLDGTTSLATITLASGTASYTTSTLALGSHTFTAFYSGSTSYAAVTSAAQTTVVAAAPSISFAANPTSLTIAHGATGTVTITGTAVGGYTGNVTFACGTLPASATCTFAPASLAFSPTNAMQSTTLTINTTTAHAMLNTAPLARTLGGIAFALLLLPLTRLRNRKSLQRLLLILVAVAAASTLSGCGGSGSSVNTTPAGTYSVPVTITAGTASSTLNLNVVVQ